MENDPNQFLANHIKEGKERVEKEQQFYEEILNELETLPKYQAFFKKYHPHSVLKFKQEFARYKANCIFHEQTFRKMEEEDLLLYHDAAVNCLWEIQQKKLFTLQCQWRAGLVNLPEAKFTAHFEYYWSHKIHECKLIKPVTQAELNDYIVYLNQVNSEDVFYFDRYQQYEEIKGTGAYKDAQAMPSYYRWWYDKYGEHELQLPDKRGDREEKYQEYEREESRARYHQIISAPDYDSRPCIFFSQDEHFENFMNKFGNKRMIDFKNVKEELNHNRGGWGLFDDCLELLEEAGDNWNIEANKDWRWGLIMAGLRYKQTMVALAIQNVYDDYLFRLENNIAPEEPDYRSTEEHINEMMRITTRGILHGWQLSGEKGEWHAGDDEMK